MTRLMEQAYARIIQLPDAEQDTIASIILEELESEAEWDRQFAGSADVLERMADQALAHLHAGRTLPLDPETL